MLKSWKPQLLTTSRRSLDQVELIREFENEFGTTIPEEEAGKITTVGGAIEYIEKNK